MTKKISAAAIAADNAKRFDSVETAARTESSGMTAMAKALQTAFAGRKLGTAKWVDGASKFTASPFYLEVQRAYYIGALSVMLPGADNLPDNEKRAKAIEVLDNRKRSDAEKTMLAALRQRWKRAMDRAGLQSPVAKDPNATAKAAATRATNRTNAGQGETAKPQPSALEQAAAKYMPSGEKNRENCVAFLRAQIANMIREVEVTNQRLIKVKSPAIPSNILGDLEDLQERAKKWVF